MSQIKNIEDIRQHVIDSLELLAEGQIDVHEASIIAKSSETVMSSLKLQLQYSMMLEEKSEIPFLHQCHKPVIEHDKVKQIEDNSNE